MNYLKDILLVGLGAAVGFTGGYFYSKNKFEKEKDEEIEEVRNYYYSKLKKNDEEVDKLGNQMTQFNNAVEEYLEKDEKVAENGQKGPSRVSKKTEYNKVGEKTKEEIVKAEAESPEEEDSNKPYFITEDEFLNDKNEYEKISLTFYNEDETLTDECDEPVDIEETVSADIYNQLKDVNGDIYIRNNVLQTDFEVMKVDAVYENGYGGY